MGTETDKIRSLVERVQVPYQITQLNKDEIDLLEQKYSGLSDRDQAEIIRIAEEIFDSEMPASVREGRWWHCLMYGIVEFLDEHYYQQAEQTARG